MRVGIEMPKVYITNKGGHDFSAARVFGDLVYLSDGKCDPYQVNQIYREFAGILQNSNKNDFLLITSLPVMNMVACAIMAYRHGRVNLLQYHAQSNTYKARTIVLDSLLNKETKNE
jgi:hypothetical protein